MKLKKEALHKASSNYDISFNHNAIAQLQRQRVWDYMSKLLANRKPELLEINCGMGDDALWLSNKCYTVTAADISGSMIAVAEGKRILQQVNNVTFRTLDSFNLFDTLGPQQYDFIFSGFGGLNAVNELELECLSAEFAKMLYPGGKISMVLMGKYCMWETLYYTAKLKWLKALRRWDNKSVPTTIEEEEFETWYHSVQTIKRIMSKEFEIVNVKPIAFAVPPFYMHNYFDSKPKRLLLLNKVDNLFLKWSFLSNFSDHFIITLQLK